MRTPSSRLNNSGKSRPKNFENIFQKIFFGAVFCLVLSGCEGSIEQACSEFPQVEAEIGLQLQAFQPYVVTGRKPAQALPSSAPSLEQKEAWLEWTEDLLKKSQKVRDRFEGDSKRRPALKAMEDASLNLVTLHGFIEQGKMKKAQGSLEKLRKSLKSAYDNACVAKIVVKPSEKAVERRPARATSKSRK